MKKIVFRCAVDDERTNRRAMEALAGVGVESIAVDIREGKMTVIGDEDPVYLARKLRKVGFRVELLSVGPAKEEKKTLAGEEVSAVEDQKRYHYSGVRQLVLKSTMEDERSKRRAMITVAGAGADSIAVDVKEGKITVIGEVNPENLVLQLRELGFRTELLSLGPAKYEKEAGKVSAIEEQGRNHYLGVQNMRLNWASEDEGSKKRIMVAVAGFGDFDSIAVDVKQGMVIVVGNVVPVSVAMKVREFGYRAKLVSVGVGSYHKQQCEPQYEPQYRLLTRVINVIYVMHIIYLFYAGKH